MNADELSEFSNEFTYFKAHIKNAESLFRSYIGVYDKLLANEIFNSVVSQEEKDRFAVFRDSAASFLTTHFPVSDENPTE